MRIVIAGAGEVGTHLAKLLSNEKQDIVLVDSDENKLSQIDSNYNLMTVVGSPTSISVLKDAGVDQADLFIAVMPFETRNITSCMLATQLGAKKTIARIDNYEYLKPENKATFQKFGVDEMFYPEMLAAEESIVALKKTWVRQWFELCDGALILVGVRIRKECEVTNKKMMDLTNGNNFFHVAAIKRKETTIIPSGSDIIQIGDIVYFTSPPDHVQDIRRMCGKVEVDVRKVLIMGGSRIALRIADYAPDDMKIKLLEIDRDKSYRLAEKTNKMIVINGDGRNVDLLKEEGIMDSDAFIALTDSSDTNILACLTAKELGIPKTIAEVEDLPTISIAEGLNIGTVINKKLLTASKIYQMLLHGNALNLKCFSLANAEVAELVANPGSKITQVPVKKLSLPKGLTIGGLSRDGQGVIVNGETQIQPDDRVVVFCLDTVLSKIDKLFN